jgi:hypothetical protein
MGRYAKAEKKNIKAGISARKILYAIDEVLTVNADLLKLLNKKLKTS